VITNLDFKVANRPILQRRIARKWYNLYNLYTYNGAQINGKDYTGLGLANLLVLSQRELFQQ